MPKLNNADVVRALSYLKDKLTMLRLRGDTESCRKRIELENIEQVIKSLTGRK